MEPRKKFTLLEDVQDLDKTIIRLIAKRTELVQRLEQNRSKTAFVAAKIAASEKDLRNEICDFLSNTNIQCKTLIIQCDCIITHEMLMHFLNGIASPKGLKLIEKYKNNLLSKN